MRAELTAKCDGPWAYESVRIQQGKLPQGIFLLGGEFSGAPVRAGARLVQVRVVKPSCNGVVYDGKHLWVRFDIGGERPRRQDTDSTPAIQRQPKKKRTPMRCAFITA